MNVEKYNAAKIWKQFHKQIFNMVSQNISDKKEVSLMLQKIYLNIHKNALSLQEMNNMEVGVYDLTKSVLSEEMKMGRPMGYREISCCLIPFLKGRTLAEQVLFLHHKLDEKARMDFTKKLGVFISGTKTRACSYLMNLKAGMEDGQNNYAA